MNDHLSTIYRGKLYVENQNLRAEISTLRAEIAELRATITEADSAFNLDGHISTWKETAGLVRMCHEGRYAMDECARHTIAAARQLTKQTADLEAALRTIYMLTLSATGTDAERLAHIRLWAATRSRESRELSNQEKTP